jgi:starch phosphorylase
MISRVRSDEQKGSARKPTMNTLKEQTRTGAQALASNHLSKLLTQYGCGPIHFTGTADALYKRHLLFDNIVDLKAAGAREQFEAAARSIRDILAQRWVQTEATYERENPKRVYYLSMEFLIGRSLANNVTNLLLGPIAQHAAQRENLDWVPLLEQEPDAGLGNGGLGRLAACFIESMATMALPGMGYGLRSSNRRFGTVGRANSPTTGSPDRIPGRSPGPTKRSR